MRYVFFTVILALLLGCSPGSRHQAKTFIKNPTPLSDKIDLNKVKIVCPSNDCPESLALFVTVYKFKTLSPNVKPNTYQAFKTCNSSVVKNKDNNMFELYTSGHCSHKEADVVSFKKQYPELKNYTYQSRSHYLYIYNKELDDTLKVQLSEPDWNYYNPDDLFSLDIMKFTIYQSLFSDLEISENKDLPKLAHLYTLRRDSGSLFTVKKQNCDVLNKSSDFTYEIGRCLILGGDSGAPIISNGEIFGFVSHTNNYSLGGQFVPSQCISSDSCQSP